jgi:PAS domain S-box-containing protein
MFKKVNYIYVISSFVALILASTLIVDLLKIRELQNAKKSDSNLSLVWFLGQADREARTLLQSVSSFYISADEMSRQEMLTSLDILWSRFDIAPGGQMEKLIYTVKSGKESHLAVHRMLELLDPLLQQLKTDDNQTLQKINGLINEHLERSYFLSINAMQDRQDIRNQRADAINGLYIHLLITLFSLVLSGLIVIGFFLRKSKHLKDQNLEFELRVFERTQELNKSNESLLVEAEVRKRADKKALQLISAIDQSKEIVFILDSDNNFVFLNESFKQINSQIEPLIKIGNSFLSYLREIADQSFGPLMSTEKEQWVDVWLSGINRSENYFEITFNDVEQFIFNADRLEDGSVIVIGSNISTLKQTQTALSISESRFRNFALIGADWYWEMDSDLKLTFLAGGVENVSGLEPDFFVGKDRSQAYGIEGAGNLRSLQSFWDKTDKRESFDEYETKWKKNNGDVITISLSGEPRYDDDDVFVGYIGAGRDVTQRCIVEERDKRLVTAINSLNLMITIYDNADKLVFYNQEFGDFKRKISHKIELGTSFEDQWRYSCDYLAETYGLDTDYWFDFRLSMHRKPTNNFVLPMGGNRYLNVFEQILDDGGVIIITTDISESKNAEQEIYKLQSYLASIIDSMSSVLIAVDSNCEVIQWNLCAEKETGINLPDAYQKQLTTVFPRLQVQMENVVDAITKGKETTQRKRLFIKDGTNCYEDVIIYPLITGEEAGAVIRLDDVTEQVMISEMMIQSEKMLSVGGLAAGMAHEINNPLAGMMQTANVMVNRLTGKHIEANNLAAQNAGTSLDVIEQYMQQRGIISMLNNITESGKRVAVIVENMLDFSRQNDASFNLHDISILLDKSLELSSTDHNLKYNYDFKNINIIKQYQDNLPAISCEAGKIQQVFLNILRNAAQAMQDFGVINPTIIFRVQYDQLNDQVVIEIEDNGPGIAEEVKRRVFEPFFSTKKEGLGTGLGLSVSYFIITENHGGKLYVDSKLGHCTMFTIVLPRIGKLTN